MKKQSKITILIVSLILLTLTIIFTAFIISNNSDNKNISKSNDDSNIEKIEDKSTDHTSKTEKTEEEPPPTSEGKLYITYGDKIITAYKCDYDLESELAHPWEIKEKFDKMWISIDSDILTFSERDTIDATLQFSRYGYPKDDLDFFIEDMIFFYDTGTNGKSNANIYLKNESKNKIARISDGNVGKNIRAFKINNTWYAYRVIVTEYVYVE